MRDALISVIIIFGLFVFGAFIGGITLNYFFGNKIEELEEQAAKANDHLPIKELEEDFGIVLKNGYWGGYVVRDGEKLVYAVFEQVDDDLEYVTTSKVDISLSKNGRTYTFIFKQ